jgi:octaprenyl-diphosphate synthase
VEKITTQSIHNPLDKLKKNYLKDLDAIDQIMMQPLQHQQPLIHSIANHLLKEGKRFRALLLLHVAKLLNYQGDQHHQLAAIVELMHAATLLHDDVIDASALRRLKETAHRLWGNKASILVGDYLYAIAFKKISTLKKQSWIQALADTTLIVVDGEIQQWQKRNHKIDESTYESIITAKTAALFSLTTRLPAMMTEQSPESESALTALGHHLGIAYQLKDDLLDYEGKTHYLGKTVGDDFMEGKATLPFIYTLTQATAAEADFLKKALNDKNADAFKQVCELIHRYKGDDYTQSKIATHINRARLAISKLPNCAHDPYLNALFDWLSTRQS